MNWSKLKFWKKSEASKTQEQLEKRIKVLEAICQIRDEEYLIKTLELDNARLTSYCILGALAYTNGGELLIESAVIETIQDGVLQKLHINQDEDGNVVIKLMGDEGEEKS